MVGGQNFPMIDNLIFGDSMSPSIKVTYGGDNGDKYESTLNYVVQEHEWLFFQSVPGSERISPFVCGTLVLKVVLTH